MLETWISDAQNHVANCGRLDPWQGLVEPRKGIAKAPAEAPKGGPDRSQGLPVSAGHLALDA